MTDDVPQRAVTDNPDDDMTLGEPASSATASKDVSEPSTSRAARASKPLTDIFETVSSKNSEDESFSDMRS